MPSPNFAYRPVLQELTEVVNDAGLDPYEAYGWLYEKQASHGLHAETYLSSSITSGGHARDESLAMAEIVARNTESARMLAEQLAVDSQIRPEAAVEPVFVGKTHWNQAEFMEFWLSVIGGFRLTPRYVARDINHLRSTAMQAFDATEVDLSVMVSSAPAQARASEYFKMSQAFANLIMQGTEAKPINTVVRMIDTDMSLGSQTERAFARQIGSRVMNISIVRPTTPASLDTVNHRLAADSARLISFGATIFDTQDNTVRLMLTESVA